MLKHDCIDFMLIIPTTVRKWLACSHGVECGFESRSG